MSEVRELTIPVGELLVTANDLSVRITGKKNSLPAGLEEPLNAVLTSLSGFNVLTGYRLCRAELDGPKLRAGNEELTVGNRLSEFLSGAETVAAFACTLDKELERAMSEITDPLEMYVTDLLGTIFVEKGVEELRKQLKTFGFDSPVNLTAAFCPGNCDWELSEQIKLFNLLPNSFLGITINACYMMSPVKSISGIIGIGKRLKFRRSGCNTCDSPNCLYRKSPYKKVV